MEIFLLILRNPKNSSGSGWITKTIQTIIEFFNKENSQNRKQN